MKPGQLSLFPEIGIALTLRDVAEAVKAAGIDGLPEATRRADQARYQEVQAKSALTESRGMPFRWALNPYRGCTHACEYCYARKYQRHLELGSGDDFSTLILVKRNLPEVLARELARPGWARESVAVGTATDPYQPIEGHYRLTRRCLEVLVAADTPLSLVTKGPMVVRDRDILQRATSGAGCQVFLSVPSVDDEAWRRLEPGTASPDQRLHAARTLRDAGIDARVLMMPLVPGISTSRGSISRTLAALDAAGVPLAGADVARFDPGVREYFFAFLAREYPELLEGYGRLYAGTRAQAAYVRDVKSLVTTAARAAPARAPRSADASRRGLTSRRRRTAS
jgi:DNA repair photolyase